MLITLLKNQSELVTPQSDIFKENIIITNTQEKSNNVKKKGGEHEDVEEIEEVDQNQKEGTQEAYEEDFES